MKAYNLRELLKSNLFLENFKLNVIKTSINQAGKKF